MTWDELRDNGQWWRGRGEDEKTKHAKAELDEGLEQELQIYEKLMGAL